MVKFKAVVTRTDEYVIEIDETVINEEWMAEFRESFYQFTTLKQHAEHLAQYRARFEDCDFVEGYGTVKVDGRMPYTRDPNAQKDSAFNIVIVDEDNDCEVDVTEVV